MELSLKVPSHELPTSCTIASFGWGFLSFKNKVEDFDCETHEEYGQIAKSKSAQIL